MGEEFNRLCLSLVDNPLQEAAEWEEYYQMVVEAFSTIGKLHEDFGGKTEISIAGSSVQGGKFYQADDLGDVDIVVASLENIPDAEQMEDVPGHPGSVRIRLDCGPRGEQHYVDSRCVKAKTPQRLSQIVQGLLVFFGQIVKDLEEFKLDLVFKYGTAAHTLELSSTLSSPSKQLEKVGIAMTPLAKSVSENLTIAGLVGSGRTYGPREKKWFKELHRATAAEVKKLEGRPLKFSEYIKSIKKAFDIGIQMVRQFETETRPVDREEEGGKQPSLTCRHNCPHENPPVPLENSTFATGPNQISENDTLSCIGMSSAESTKKAKEAENYSEKDNLFATSTDVSPEMGASSGISEEPLQAQRSIGSDEEILYDRKSGNIPITKKRAEEYFGPRLMHFMLGLNKEQSSTMGGLIGLFKQEDLPKSDVFRIPLDGSGPPLTNQEEAHVAPVRDYPRKLHVDIVPALKCTGWPKVASLWPKRSRKWPPQHVVSDILEKGFYVVAKHPDVAEIEDPDSIFRLGFPITENLLSDAMSPTQHKCYRVLKALHQKLFKPNTENFSSYHIKTTLFWVSEDTDGGSWSDGDIGNWILLILKKLRFAVGERQLAHYFIPSLNLFQKLTESEFAFLETQLDSIINDPTGVLKSLIHDIQETAISVASRSLPEETAQPPVNLNLTPGQTFHDRWTEEYDKVSQEAIEAASSTSEIDETDPDFHFVANEYRKLVMEHNLSKEMLRKVIGQSKGMSYLKYIYNVAAMKAADMRAVVLKDLRVLVRFHKYLVEQPDFGPGNEEALLIRAMEEIGHNDPNRFDMAELFPKVDVSNIIQFYNSMSVPLPGQSSSGEDVSGRESLRAGGESRRFVDDIDLD